MKNLSILFCLAGLLWIASCQSPFTSRKTVDVQLPIIPEPLTVTVFDQQYLFPQQLIIEAADRAGKGVSAIMKEVLTGHGFEVEVVNAVSEKATIKLRNSKATPDTLGTEGYHLSITSEGVQIEANTEAGMFYGFQSMMQLLPVGNGEKPVVSQVEIIDKPRFTWRGLHLDVCRHFFSVEFVKKYIDQMAKYKLNRFHWHLTEDQGWRIEIKKYPQLTKIGAFRKETILDKNFDPYIGDGTPHGGYYSQEEIREVVAYAAERFVTVVPEIEMPGHSLAALSAYPRYSCTGGPFEVGTKWGVFEDIYCTKEETFTFLTDILDEVVSLFPSEYIHIGGDEAPKARWKKCPDCQRRIREEGLQDEHELQSYFVRRIENHLQQNGRKLIGWDEILEGGLSPGATVMSWRGEEGGIDAARQGHDVIMTPNFVMYFDHYQGPKDQEPLAIGGDSPLDKVYAYDPLPEQLLPEQQKYVLGVQANVWTEYMKTSDHVEYMAYPRVLALSEIAWSVPEKKNLPFFLEKVNSHAPRLTAAGINFRKQTTE